MGLDISHNCWDGGYGGFNNWRCTIAKIIGVPYEFMEGCYRDGNYLLPEYMKECLPIKWSILKKDDIYPLLYHSDCDGEIPPKQCGKIAKRLEEILPDMPSDRMKEVTERFIKGLKLAHERDEKVEFC